MMVARSKTPLSEASLSAAILVSGLEQPAESRLHVFLHEERFGDRGRLSKLSDLQLCDQVDQRLEVSVIRRLKSIKVFRLVIPRHDKREEPVLHKNKRGNCTGNAPVPSLKRVDLGEPVVRPRRLDFARHGFLDVVGMHADQQPIHLGTDMLRRAIGEGYAVPHGIVGLRLPRALDERDLDMASLRIETLCCVLAAQQGGVEFLDVRHGKVSVALYEIEDAIEGVLLISQQLDHVFARLVRRAVAQQFGLKAPLDQRLRDASLDLVEVLNEAGLDRPFSVY